MNRLAIVILFCLCAASNSISAAVPADSLKTRYIDTFNIQFMGGVNKSVNENMPFSEWTSHPFAYGGYIGLAKEFSPLWGWRFSLGYDKNKSRNLPFCEKQDSWSWDDIEGFADITFDFTDLIAKRRKHRFFDMKLFAGLGGMWTWGFPQNIPLSYDYPFSRESSLCYAGHTGVTFKFKVSPTLAIAAEAVHHVAADNFNGVKESSAPFDSRSNVNLGIVWTPAKKKKQKETVVLDDPRLTEIPALPYVMPQTEEMTGTYSGSAYLDYPVNQTVIYDNYGNNLYELKKIRESLDIIEEDNTLVVTSIKLHGTASPEAPYSLNTRLASGRTLSLKNLITKEYHISDDLFTLDSTPENWKDLRTYLETRFAKDAPQYAEYIPTILALMDSVVDQDERERKIKALGEGKPYAYLLRNVYPRLRRTDYWISYSVRQYTEKELNDLIYVSPESLTLTQINKVAFSYPLGSRHNFNMLMIAAKVFPDVYDANLNAACACIQTGRLKDAKRYIDKLDNSQDASYLSRVVAAMEGNWGWKKENGKIIVD